MSKSDSTKNWEHGTDAPIGLASSAFIETPDELHIKKQVRVDKRGIENYDTLNKAKECKN